MTPSPPPAAAPPPGLTEAERQRLIDQVMAYTTPGGSSIAYRSLAEMAVAALEPELAAQRPLPEHVVALLHHIDGQLGLAVHRNEHDQRWKDEASDIISRIRAVLRGTAG